MKQCTNCKQPKDLSHFYKSHLTNTGKQVYKPRCKECESIKKKAEWAQLSTEERKARNTNNKNKDYHKNYRLTTKYNITLEQFNEMYAQQGGKCYICKEDVPEDQIRVDHHHESGKVRKLLCHNCNSVLGHAKEDPNILLRCMEYLNDTF